MDSMEFHPNGSPKATFWSYRPCSELGENSNCWLQLHRCRSRHYLETSLPKGHRVMAQKPVRGMYVTPPVSQSLCRAPSCLGAAFSILSKEKTHLSLAQRAVNWVEDV